MHPDTPQPLGQSCNAPLPLRALCNMKKWACDLLWICGATASHGCTFGPEMNTACVTCSGQVCVAVWDPVDQSAKGRDWGAALRTPHTARQGTQPTHPTPRRPRREQHRQFDGSNAYWCTEKSVVRARLRGRAPGPLRRECTGRQMITQSPPPNDEKEWNGVAGQH